MERGGESIPNMSDQKGERTNRRVSSRHEKLDPQHRHRKRGGRKGILLYFREGEKSSIDHRRRGERKKKFGNNFPKGKEASSIRDNIAFGA